MKNLANALWATLCVDLFVMAGYVFDLIGSGIISDFDFTFPFGLAAVLIAAVTIVKEHNRNSSKDYLESAISLMDKAYKILDDSKDELGVPKNSRLNWLTAARLVKTAQMVADQIIEESHKSIWADQKIFWRAQIRSLIMPTAEGFPATYYAESSKKFTVYGRWDQEPLSERSLAVLHHFIQWGKSEEDPIKSEPLFTKEEIRNMTLWGPHGLGGLLQEVYADQNAD